VPDAAANVAKFEGGPCLKIIIGAWPDPLIWYCAQLLPPKKEEEEKGAHP
jgi:hypothetical protein